MKGGYHKSDLVNSWMASPMMRAIHGSGDHLRPAYVKGVWMPPPIQSAGPPTIETREVAIAPKVKRPKITRETDVSNKRNSLLTSWERVMRWGLDASKVGRLMAREGSYEEELEVLRLALFEKSNSTLAGRLAPLLAYTKCWKTKSENLEWPPDEASAYRFLKIHAGPTMPASRASQFMEALRFLHHVLGFDLQDALSSRRLTGYAEEQRRRLGGRAQAPALTLGAVRTLEQAFCERRSRRCGRLGSGSCFGATVAKVSFQ